MSENRDENSLERILEQELNGHMPTLKYLYKHCRELLRQYREDSPEAYATLAFLAHGVRELMNSIPDILGTDITTRRSDEDDAIEALRNALTECGPISITDNDTGEVSISHNVALALVDYQKARAIGTNNATDRMAAVFLGDANARGGSLVPVKDAEDFFMRYVHFDRTERSTLPPATVVAQQFKTIETSLHARMGNFFEAKKQLEAFVEEANRKDASGEYREPSRQEVDHGLSLAADPNLAFIFFGKLENPLWLKHLAQRKALTNLATAESTGDWREYAYVIKMAPLVPTEVCTALSTASTQSPELVRRGTLECAAQMPADNATHLLRKMRMWTGDNAALEDWTWQPKLLSKLFASVLANEETAKDGNKFMQDIYRPRPISDHTKGVAYYGEFASLVHSSQYYESLENALQWLPTQVQVAILRTFLHDIESVRSFDGPIISSHFIPSIDDAVRDESDSIEKQLARLVCKPLSRLLDEDSGRFQQQLTNFRHHVVQRAAMYVLSQALMDAGRVDMQHLLELTAEALRIPHVLSGDYDPELFPLVRSVKTIDPSFSLENLLTSLDEEADDRVSRWRGGKNALECLSEQEMEQEAACIGRQYKHRILSLIGQENLRDEWLDMFLELKNEFGPTRYEERHIMAYEYSWGPSSPISLEEMLAMGPASLIGYLHSSSFDKRDFASMDSHRGQGIVLTQLIRSHPDMFSGYTSDLKTLRPTYITAVICGWAHAIEDRSRVNIDDLIDLCSQLAEIPDGTAYPSEGNQLDDDSDYDAARREAAHLIESLLSHIDPKMLEPAQDRLLDLLIRFSGSVLPTEDPAQQESMASPTFYLACTNETRTIAIIALGKWVYRFGESSRVGDALEVLERYLPSRTSSVCNAAAIGFTLPYLVFSAEEWAGGHYADLFGNIENDTCQQTVLATVLVAFRYSNRLYDYLRPTMLKAIQGRRDDCGLDLHSSYLQQLIGNWALLSLLLGRIGFSDDLLSLWEKKSSPECQCDVLLYHCKGIRNSGSTKIALVVRIVAVWDRVFGAVASSSTGDCLQESLYHLIKTGFVPSSWWAPRLEGTFEYTADCGRMSLLEDELEHLAKTHPAHALDILNKAASNAKSAQTPRYSLRRAAVHILGTVLARKSPDLTRRANEIMSALGRAGLTDLDTLVEEYVCQPTAD